MQQDTFQGHYHNIRFEDYGNIGGGGAAHALRNEDGYNTNSNNLVRQAISDGTNGEPRVGNETRAMNATIRIWKRTA